MYREIYRYCPVIIYFVVINHIVNLTTCVFFSDLVDFYVLKRTKSVYGGFASLIWFRVRAGRWGVCYFFYCSVTLTTDQQKNQNNYVSVIYFDLCSSFSSFFFLLLCISFGLRCSINMWTTWKKYKRELAVAFVCWKTWNNCIYLSLCTTFLQRDDLVLDCITME